MIDVLIGALKISLAQCNKIEDPAEYTYEINQVLNRFKTNLFKLIPDKAKHLYDPKEFIQIRLCLNWKIGRVYTGDYNIKENSPVLLHINGFIPELGLRKNKERTFIKCVDVGDVVDLKKIASIKTDYFNGPSVNSALYKSELDIIEEKTYGSRNFDMCIYHDKDKFSDHVFSFTVQISAIVFDHELKVHYRASADRMTTMPTGGKVPHHYL